MAPTPEQLEKIREAVRASGKDENEQGDVTVIIRDQAWSEENGNVAPHLKHRVTQLIRSVHWEHQKKVLDLVEAIVGSDRQWIVVRKFLFDIQKQQEYKMTTLIGRMIAQEFMENEDGRGTEGNSGSAGSDAPEQTVGTGRGTSE